MKNKLQNQYLLRLLSWPMWVWLAFILMGSCSKVPITGRNKLSLIPQSQLLQTSFAQYNQFLAENKLSSDQQQKAIVQRVGNHVKDGIEKYLRDNGKSEIVKDFQWEFNLVEDKAVNAWAMPGGKVVVYTGILPVVQNETGLAVVLGHEIAHIIAGHGQERLSQGLVAQLGAAALDVATMNKSPQARQLFMQAYGAGAQVGVLLPYSRLQESEADQMGLIFMAIAGYDPQQAVPFWERMKATGGQEPPEILSTHPHNQSRIKGIQKHMKEAMKYYNKSNHKQ